MADKNKSFFLSLMYFTEGFTYAMSAYVRNTDSIFFDMRIIKF